MKAKNIFLALACGIALTVSPVLAWDYCPPPQVAPGAVDVKVDVNQGASGVVGVVKTVSTEQGVKTEKTSIDNVNGTVAGGLNPVCNGGVLIGNFDFTKTSTDTCTFEVFKTLTCANTLQNVAEMNGQVIAAATACGPATGAFDVGANQLLVQSGKAALPGGYASTLYVGATNIQVKGTVH